MSDKLGTNLTYDETQTGFFSVITKSGHPNEINSDTDRSDASSLQPTRSKV